MKKVLFILLLILPLLFASEFPQYQNKYVNDFANVFTSEQVDSLRSILSEVEKNTTAEVVVVTVDTTEPYVPSEYRTKLFNEWKIGDKNKDNGLLIVYAVKEKRMEVEIGYGLEGILPDSKVGRYLDDYYVPLRDENKTAEGIMLFTENIVNALEGEEAVKSNKNTKTVYIVLMFIIFLIVIFVIGNLMNKGTNFEKGKRSGNDWSPFGGFSGGGFVGGSSGGFGGGSSGGGGVGR